MERVPELVEQLGEFDVMKAFHRESGQYCQMLQRSLARYELKCPLVFRILGKCSLVEW